MIPSRGLLLSSRAIGIGRQRLETVPIRSFSASAARNGALRTTVHPSRGGRFGLKVSRRPEIQLNSSILRNGTLIRFKSTNVPPAAIPSPASEPSSAETLSGTSSNLPDWASTTSDFNSENAVDLNFLQVLDIPERIGYLKELGLDYGWGPTSMMEFIIEHIHVYSGMPWWGSIIATAFFVRLVFFKLFMNASDNAARLASIAHLTKPIMAKQKLAMARSDTAEVMRLRQENGVIMSRAGIKMWRSFAPMISVVTGYGTFILLRAMAHIPVPGLEDGGILWFQNLAVSDPYYILPLITSAVLHIAIRQGGETGANTMSQTAVRAFSVVLPAISLIFTSFMPAGLQLSFMFTGVFTYLQGRIFRAAAFRRTFNMVPMPSSTSSAAPPSGGAAEPSYQSRIITVKPNAEGTWEAPRGKDTSGSDSASKTKSSIVTSLGKNIEETIGAIKTSHKNTVKKANEMMGRTKPDGVAMSKKERKIVAQVEGKRRVEEAQKRARYDREKLARRMARKREEES